MNEIEPVIVQAGFGFFFQLILAIGLFILDLLFGPKPKRNTGPEFQDLEDPTASAGRKIPRVYGCKRVKGVNVLSFTDKSKQETSINA